MPSRSRLRLIKWLSFEDWKLKDVHGKIKWLLIKKKKRSKFLSICVFIEDVHAPNVHRRDVIPTLPSPASENVHTVCTHAGQHFAASASRWLSILADSGLGYASELASNQFLPLTAASLQLCAIISLFTFLFSIPFTV